MTIHFWNTRVVVRDLAGVGVSETDACGYLVASSLLVVAGYYLGVFVVPPIGWSLVYEFLLVGAVTVVGMRECFRANGGRDGQDFILRFTCVALPINVKLALLGWGLVFVTYRYPDVVIDPAVFVDPERAWAVISLAWLPAFTSVFYWRVWHHLQLLRETRRPAAS